MTFSQAESRPIETAPKDREFYGVVSDRLKYPVAVINPPAAVVAVCRWQDGVWLCSPSMTPSHWYPKTS
jgi:hypothetical protein